MSQQSPARLEHELNEPGPALVTRDRARPQTPRPPLSGQVTWTLVGNVGYAASQWVMLVILAKILAPPDVGRFGLGLAIATPVIMFTNLQLRSLQATEAAEHLRFSHYFGARLLSSGIAFAAILGIATAVRYPAGTVAVVVAVALGKCIEAIADTIYGHLQRAEMMSRIAISMLIRGTVAMAFLFIAVRATRSVLDGVLAMAGGSLLTLLLYDLPSARRAERSSQTLRFRSGPEGASQAIKPSWDPQHLRTIVRLGLPLGLTSVLLALAANIPRYFLERSWGEAALGYFVAMAYPTAAFSILLSAFGQAATPRMAEAHRTDRARFRRLVWLLAAVVAGTAVAAAAIAVGIGPRLLAILYRKDYAQYFGVFLVLLASAAAWSIASVLGYAATCSRRLRLQAPASALICGVTFAASLGLVGPFGVQGAAIVSLIAGLAGILVYGLLLKLGSDLDLAV